MIRICEPGRGSTFTVYLTRHLEAGVEPARKEETVSVAGTETVLLVEDEPAILDEGVQFIQKP